MTRGNVSLLGDSVLGFVICLSIPPLSFTDLSFLSFFCMYFESLVLSFSSNSGLKEAIGDDVKHIAGLYARVHDFFLDFFFSSMDLIYLSCMHAS